MAVLLPYILGPPAIAIIIFAAVLALTFPITFLLYIPIFLSVRFKLNKDKLTINEPSWLLPSTVAGGVISAVAACIFGPGITWPVLPSVLRWKDIWQRFCSTFFRGWWGAVTTFQWGVAVGEQIFIRLAGAVLLAALPITLAHLLTVAGRKVPEIAHKGLGYQVVRGLLNKLGALGVIIKGGVVRCVESISKIYSWTIWLLSLIHI